MFRTTVKVGKPHDDCKFTREGRSHLVQLLRHLCPGDSQLARFGRKCRSLLLISEEIGRRIYLPMGSVGYNFEKEQQLTQHQYMIHPYSKFYHYWKICAVIEFIISFFSRLLIISHWEDIFYSPLYQMPFLISDLIETFDTLMRLLVGYVDKDSQCVVLEFRKVLHRNLHQILFYVDLLVSLPLDFIVFVYSFIQRPPTVFIYSSFWKILKIFSVIRYLNDLSKVYNWNELCLRIVLFFFITFHLGHWLACLCYAGDETTNFPAFASDGSPNEAVIRHHLQCFYVVCNIFFGQTAFFSNRIFDTDIGPNVIWIIFINLISFLQIFLLSMFIQLVALTKSSSILYSGMKREIQKYLAQENIPKQVHKKVLKFLKFRYDGKYFDENAIIETLSPPLKREVKKFLCYDLIINSESIFNCLPEELASQLCLLMKLRIYIAGDTIFRAGQKSTSIYFLYSGSVVIYSSRGKELTHWYKGQQFGVASFMESHLYLLTAVALETSEIYVLRHRDFMEVTKDSPELFQTVARAASARIDMLLREYPKDT